MGRIRDSVIMKDTNNEEISSTEKFGEGNGILEVFDVFNSVEVRAPEIEFDAYHQIPEGILHIYCVCNSINN